MVIYFILFLFLTHVEETHWHVRAKLTDARKLRKITKYFSISMEIGHEKIDDNGLSVCTYFTKSKITVSL